MKLIFHIGTEKTGTTSAQSWFAANRENLAAQGVVYGRALGEINHRKLSLWSIDPARPDQGFLQFRVRTRAERTAFRDELPAAFAAEVAEARAAGAHTVVISNEHCHSRLKTPEEVARARDFLSPHFNTIEVLCVLRPQVDVAVSLASTISRVRFPVTSRFFDKATPDNPYYDYDGLVRRWSDVFGEDRLTLCNFTDVPSVADYLVRRLGIDTAGFIPQERKNEAIDVRTMAIVNAVKVPLFLPDGTRNPWAELFIDKLPCTERLQIGEATARAIQARFDASNAALATSAPARRAGIGAADLAPDWRRYAAAANLAMLDQECPFAGQLDELIRLFNERIALETLQLRLAEAERAVSRGRWKNARRWLGQARNLQGLLAASPYFRDEAIGQRTALEALEAQLPEDDSEDAAPARPRAAGGRKRRA